MLPAVCRRRVRACGPGAAWPGQPADQPDAGSCGPNCTRATCPARPGTPTSVPLTVRATAPALPTTSLTRCLSVKVFTWPACITPWNSSLPPAVVACSQLRPVAFTCTVTRPRPACATALGSVGLGDADGCAGAELLTWGPDGSAWVPLRLLPVPPVTAAATPYTTTRTSTAAIAALQFGPERRSRWDAASDS